VAGPAPLVPAELRFAAPERTGPDGPLRALDPDLARALIEEIALAGAEAVAVALLHSYAHPAHERLLGALLGELLGDVHVSLSCELVGTFREYERTATTVLDAALSPLLGGYLRRLSGEARARGLPEPLIMQSSGGLTDSQRAASHAALTVLSGPAGGVGGALLLAELAGEPDVLCFDMGGTSCDVCLIDGSQVAETAERAIAGRPLSLPALDIHTVGAGGGSIAWRDRGGALRVGPASAGAVPGPACYGRGGAQPTVTDANLLLGRLLEDSPLAGALDARPRRRRAARVSRLAGELGMDPLACARGIVRVAEAEMLGALRLMTVERGIDPRGFALLPSAAPGPCTPPPSPASWASSASSARAPPVCSARSAWPRPLRAATSRARSCCSGGSLTAERAGPSATPSSPRPSAGSAAEPARCRVRHELRYRGQSFELAVEQSRSADPGALREAFARAHEKRYGYRDDSAEVELVNMRVSLWGPHPRCARSRRRRRARAGTRSIVFDGEALEAAVLRGEPRRARPVGTGAVRAAGGHAARAPGLVGRGG
jgi:N-methylhydantoinase A